MVGEDLKQSIELIRVYKPNMNGINQPEDLVDSVPLEPSSTHGLLTMTPNSTQKLPLSLPPSSSMLKRKPLIPRPDGVLQPLRANPRSLLLNLSVV